MPLTPSPALATMPTAIALEYKIRPTRSPSSEYDLLNRLVAVTDPLGETTEYGYDANGNRTAITDSLGMVTTFVYDPLNRLDQYHRSAWPHHDDAIRRRWQPGATDRRHGPRNLVHLRRAWPAQNSHRPGAEHRAATTTMAWATGRAWSMPKARPRISVYDQVNRLVLTEDPLDIAPCTSTTSSATWSARPTPMAKRLPTNTTP